MKNEFSKKYEHQIEKQIYESWNKKGYFEPQKALDAYIKQGWIPKNENFSIAMPPPNVTGVLHLWHALMLAIQDTMIRRARMDWKKTLWIPGSDHAGIATQVKVEQNLAKDKIFREKIGREKFLKYVWDWAYESRDTIIWQTKAMWSSADWSREQFTLSESLSRAVRKAFSKLYKEGKITKDSYIVNWCPRCKTVISDVEVNYEEKEWNLYYIKYFFDWKPDSLSIATTRPETMFADVALAVNPQDKRYKKYIGRHVLIPIINKSIPVIADKAVDAIYGTGTLKITPAHDPADYEVWKRHDLPLDVFAIDKNWILTDIAGEFAWKIADENVENIIQYLDEIWNLEKIETINHKVPHCERCNSTIQPMVSSQWFLDVKDSAQKAMVAVRTDETKIYPDRFNKTFFNWLEDIRPWCISRQLWWWHRIPVWFDKLWNRYVLDEDNIKNDWETLVLSQIVFNLVADWRLENPFSVERLIDVLFTSSLVPSQWEVWKQYINMYKIKYSQDKKLLEQTLELEYIFSNSSEQAGEKLFSMLEKSSSINEQKWKFEFMFDWKDWKQLSQEEDVLDTWFSSGLWPFSILGWPEKTQDYKDFYPNSVMETGYDILFFRVTRMMMLGFENTDITPFKNVYLHGLIRTENWEKMSKSKWSQIDPMDLIKEYGADATRFSIINWNTPWNDLRFSLTKIDYAKRFLTKLWNASRYVSTKLGLEYRFSYDLIKSDLEENNTQLNRYDLWILNWLNELIENVNSLEEKLMLGEASQKLIDFVRKFFCDWYIEIIKVENNDFTNKTTLYVLGSILKLLHPYIPFITENIWGHIFEWDLIVTSSASKINVPESEKDLIYLIDLITELRNIKSTNNQSDLTINLDWDENQLEFVKSAQELITRLTQIKSISYEKVDHFHSMVDWIKISMTTSTVSKAKQLQNLQSQIEKEKEFLQQLRNIITNPSFLDKATPEVVAQKQAKLDEVKTKISNLELEVSKLKSM